MGSAQEDGPLSEHLAAEIGGLVALLKARRKPSESQPPQREQNTEARASHQKAHKDGDANLPDPPADNETRR